MKELEKNFNPKDVEDNIYKNWMEKKYFHAEVDESKEPFTIMMPPPNITGQLHTGHALNNTIQDILIRFKRMQGYNALWIPGTDHASISTEVRIVKKMAEEGLTKEGVGREEFLKRAWEWKAQYGSRITEQLKKIGSSCDWDRERFTMDEGLSNAVEEVFVRLHEKGYIYKGEKLVNWCTKCQTTISDAEVEHKESKSHLYHVKYQVKGTDEYLTFATTRPETILGDVALAVNPKDERYEKLVGKTAIVPIVNREIPIIADEYIEIGFGTGVLKVTPAHDINDFEVGERHNLPKINIMNNDGTLNENNAHYSGMDRVEAREKIVAELDKLGLFVKREELNNSVGVHERCNEVIEPLIKAQWFVKMEEMAKPAIDEYKKENLRIIPERFGKIYLHWLENIRDWCISRQLWWGHRIPAYYCVECGEMVVSRICPSTCKSCNSTKFEQDEDVLDTWFSSALWPFSTLGWPDDTKELKYFYPTNVLVTSYDIIFFWVVRMVFSGIEQMGQLPFKDVYVYGLMRDAQGRKMSKSLDNGIDPLEVIDKYGTDALRLSLIMGISAGNDTRFQLEKVESARNFLNKLWNATRFMLMNMDGEPKSGLEQLTKSDKWILSKANALTKEVTEHIDSYELGLAVQKVHDFVWDEFCDWYIEMVKPRLYNKEDKSREAALWTLKTVLIKSLKLLHPFTPFITEEIFVSIQKEEETIMLANWDKFEQRYNFPQEEKEISGLKEAVKAVRSARLEMNVPPSKKVSVVVVSKNDEAEQMFESGKVFFASLASASEVTVVKDTETVGDAEKTVAIPLENAVIYMPFAEMVDIEKEKERLKREKVRLENEVLRIEKKLSNEGFVSKAPKQVIDEEKGKRLKYEAMLKEVVVQIEKL